MTPAALGFRAHSGWAVMVAIGGTAASIELIDRRRIELVSGATPRQPYHAAEGLALQQAEKVVRQCTSQATAMAQQAVSDALQQVQARRYKIGAAAIVSASARPLPDLATILSSHPLLHTAEGELFRAALSQACEHHGLPVMRVSERDLYSTASAKLSMAEEEIRTRLSEMGRSAGPPWRQDEKLATLIAWLALATAARGKIAANKASAF